MNWRKGSELKWAELLGENYRYFNELKTKRKKTSRFTPDWCFTFNFSSSVNWEVTELPIFAHFSIGKCMKIFMSYSFHIFEPKTSCCWLFGGNHVVSVVNTEKKSGFDGLNHHKSMGDHNEPESWKPVWNRPVTAWSFPNL